MGNNPVRFRVFSPDETSSNRGGAVFEVTDRAVNGVIRSGDDQVAPGGRVWVLVCGGGCAGRGAERPQRDPL